VSSPLSHAGPAGTKVHWSRRAQGSANFTEIAQDALQVQRRSNRSGQQSSSLSGKQGINRAQGAIHFCDAALQDSSDPLNRPAAVVFPNEDILLGFRQPRQGLQNRRGHFLPNLSLHELSNGNHKSPFARDPRWGVSFDSCLYRRISAAKVASFLVKIEKKIYEEPHD